MTVFARCPEHHAADDAHVRAPVSFGFVGIAASMSEASRSCDRTPRRLVAADPPSESAWLTMVTARATTSFSISATMDSVWFPAISTSSSWNRGLACRTPPGPRWPLPPRRSATATSWRDVRRFRPDATSRTAAGSMMVRASKTSASGTLRACSTMAAVRAVSRDPAGGPRHRPAPPGSPRSVPRPPGCGGPRAAMAGTRRTLDQVRLMTQRVALVELAEDDEAPQLVGDLLGFSRGFVPGRARAVLAFSAVMPTPVFVASTSPLAQPGKSACRDQTIGFSPWERHEVPECSDSAGRRRPSAPCDADDVDADDGSAGSRRAHVTGDPGPETRRYEPGVVVVRAASPPLPQCRLHYVRAAH